MHIKKAFAMILLILGLGGAVMFFPVQLDDRYTCFYHRLVDSEEASSVTVRHVSGPSPSPGEGLIHSYFHGFAFMWWGSLAFLALGVYRMQKIKKNETGYAVLIENTDGRVN